MTSRDHYHQTPSFGQRMSVPFYRFYLNNSCHLMTFKNHHHQLQADPIIWTKDVSFLLYPYYSILTILVIWWHLKTIIISLKQKVSILSPLRITIKRALKTIILILILWNTTSLTSSLTRFLWQGQELRSEKVSSVGDNLSPASLVLRNISRSYRVIISVIIIISLSFTISAFSNLWSQLSVNTNGLTKIFCFCQRRDALLTVIIMVSFIINFNIIIIPKKSRLESGEYGCKASNSEGEGFSRPFALTVQRKLHAVHTSIFWRRKKTFSFKIFNHIPQTPFCTDCST